MCHLWSKFYILAISLKSWWRHLLDTDHIAGVRDTRNCTQHVRMNVDMCSCATLMDTCTPHGYQDSSDVDPTYSPARLPFLNTLSFLECALHLLPRRRWGHGRERTESPIRHDLQSSFVSHWARILIIYCPTCLCFIPVDPKLWTKIPLFSSA